MTQTRCRGLDAYAPAARLPHTMRLKLSPVVSSLANVESVLEIRL